MSSINNDQPSRFYWNVKALRDFFRVSSGACASADREGSVRKRITVRVPQEKAIPGGKIFQSPSGIEGMCPFSVLRIGIGLCPPSANLRLFPLLDDPPSEDGFSSDPNQ